jgi:hypothetical protein
VNNYNTAHGKLEQLTKIPEFAAFIEKAERKPDVSGNFLASVIFLNSHNLSI